jgi:hypothetical protein
VACRLLLPHCRVLRSAPDFGRCFFRHGAFRDCERRPQLSQPTAATSIWSKAACRVSGSRRRARIWADCTSAARATRTGSARSLCRLCTRPGGSPAGDCIRGRGFVRQLAVRPLLPREWAMPFEPPALPFALAISDAGGATGDTLCAYQGALLVSCPRPFQRRARAFACPEPLAELVALGA